MIPTDRAKSVASNCRKNCSPLRVVKIGGSLLQLQDLKARLLDWHLSNTSCPSVYIVGGGRLVDEIRDLDRRLGPCPIAVHQMCLQAMSINSQLVSALTGWPIVVWPADNPAGDDWPGDDGFGMLDERTAIVLDLQAMPQAFTRTDWSFTSDSLAALAAGKLAADQLILLKSVQSPPEATPEQLARTGVVDSCFPEFASGIPRISVRSLV